MIAAPYPAPVAIHHIIDLNLNHIGYQGWQIVEHQKAVDGINVPVWYPARVELYVDDAQKNNDLHGNTVRERLKGKRVLNANALDHLLRNPQLIPEDWKKDKRGRPRRIFFSGTTYSRPNYDLYARCLCWSDKWGWDVLWLGARWQDNYAAALWHIE